MGRVASSRDGDGDAAAKATATAAFTATAARGPLRQDPLLPDVPVLSACMPSSRFGPRLHGHSGGLNWLLVLSAPTPSQRGNGACLGPGGGGGVGWGGQWRGRAVLTCEQVSTEAGAGPRRGRGLRLSLAARSWPRSGHTHQEEAGEEVDAFGVQPAGGRSWHRPGLGGGGGRGHPQEGQPGPQAGEEVGRQATWERG